MFIFFRKYKVIEIKENILGQSVYVVVSINYSAML
jgi:hypothetical protein